MENFSEIRKCRLCGNSLENKPWKSEWNARHHYKSNICGQCGKKTWIKVSFDGSGHDDWKPVE